MIHVEKMAAREKDRYLKFNNRAGFIYDNERIAVVEYKVDYNQENQNDDYSEEDQKNEDYTDSKNNNIEDQDKDLESEEEINEDEPASL